MEQTADNQNNLLEAIANDRAVRQAVARESHLLFFSVYLAHYIKYPVAEFQKDIFRITEDMSNRLACIVAFRGSGKSTLITLSYALWAILGVQKKKFVLIICQTQAQARQHMANLRRELESNPLLKSDLGPFREEDGEWAMSSIVFQNTGARIMVASIDQSIRGIRHHEHRPDLLILDDIEDLNSTKTMDGRQKTFDWFTREVMPLGDIGTRVFLVGNLLHEDCLVMRLRKKIEAKELKGFFGCYPLLDEDGICLWPKKFDTQEKIEELRKSIGNELAWRQEYLLQTVSADDQVIPYEWLEKQDYETLPDEKDLARILISVDPASSKKQQADCTAIVVLSEYHSEDNRKIYVHPNPVNEKLSGMEIEETIASLYGFHGKQGPVEVLVETTSQNYLSERLLQRGVNARECRPKGDKRERLLMAGAPIQAGMVFFPKGKSEDLKLQLTGFGSERFDDLVDAFSQGVNEIMNGMFDPYPEVIAV